MNATVSNLLPMPFANWETGFVSASFNTFEISANAEFEASLA